MNMGTCTVDMLHRSFTYTKAYNRVFQPRSIPSPAVLSFTAVKSQKGSEPQLPTGWLMMHPFSSNRQHLTIGTLTTGRHTSQVKPPVLSPFQVSQTSIHLKFHHGISPRRFIYVFSCSVTESKSNFELGTYIGFFTTHST